MKKTILGMLFIGLMTTGFSLVADDASAGPSEARLRERLAGLGYSAEQVDTLVGERKAKREQKMQECQASGMSEDECRAQFKERMKHRRGKFEKRKRQCKEMGLSREECRAQFKAKYKNNQ